MGRFSCDNAIAFLGLYTAPRHSSTYNTSLEGAREQPRDTRKQNYTIIPQTKRLVDGNIRRQSDVTKPSASDILLPVWHNVNHAVTVEGLS